MILTRRVLFEKERTLYNAILRSQKEKRITDEASFLLADLCRNYVNKIGKYSMFLAKQDMYYSAIVECYKHYDKYNPKHYSITKGREDFHCKSYFKIIIRHHLRK